MHNLRGKALTALLAAAALAALLPGCRPTAQPSTAAAAEPVNIRFAVTTEAAGVRFRHTHGGSGKRYMPETVGSGCAWLDYDGDGRADLLFVNARPLPGTKAAGKPTPALYRNRGDGRFEDRTAGSGLDVSLYGQGVSAADYDGDGDVDVFITCVGPNRLFRNEGAGEFTDITAAAGLWKDTNPWRYHSGSAWLDYDRDGWLDLFVARYVKWTPETDPFCGAPGGEKRYCPPWKSPREYCALYRNLGNGRFQDVSAAAGIGGLDGYWFQPFVVDYDTDGWPDVAVVSDGTPSALWRNEGGKRFTDVAPETGFGLSETGSPKAQMGIDAASWRNDGREALLVGNFSGERLSLYEPEGGLFTDIADRVGMGESSLYSLTFGVAFLDADRDGWRDAFVGNGHIDDFIEKFDPNVTYAQRPLFYRNLRGERFAEVGGKLGAAFAQKLVVRGCATADYDLDGDADLALTEVNRPAHLFRNDTPTTNRYLRVKLQGKGPNRHGVGARVEVTADGMRQVQWVRAGGHFYSQSEFPLTFGAGSARTADVTVTWPRGGRSEQKGVLTNQAITLAEGLK